MTVFHYQTVPISCASDRQRGRALLSLVASVPSFTRIFCCHVSFLCGCFPPHRMYLNTKFVFKYILNQESQIHCSSASWVVSLLLKKDVRNSIVSVKVFSFVVWPHWSSLCPAWFWSKGLMFDTQARHAVKYQKTKAVMCIPCLKQQLLWFCISSYSKASDWFQ